MKDEQPKRSWAVVPPVCQSCTLAQTCSCPWLSTPQVYSGGLGSYALLVMVAAFLQLHPSRAPAGAQRRPLRCLQCCAVALCSLCVALRPLAAGACLRCACRLPVPSFSPVHRKCQFTAAASSP